MEVDVGDVIQIVHEIISSAKSNSLFTFMISALSTEIKGRRHGAVFLVDDQFVWDLKRLQPLIPVDQLLSAFYINMTGFNF